MRCARFVFLNLLSREEVRKSREWKVLNWTDAANESFTSFRPDWHADERWKQNIFALKFSWSNLRTLMNVIWPADTKRDVCSGSVYYSPWRECNQRIDQHSHQSTLSPAVTSVMWSVPGGWRLRKAYRLRKQKCLSRWLHKRHVGLRFECFCATVTFLVCVI